MDPKKSGIRLRHLQQQPNESNNNRDLSPNNPNRKKIFQKIPSNRLQQRLSQQIKVVPAKMQIIDNNSSIQYEQLIQNLKHKSMQLQLRDNMIKSLNKEIGQLKKHLRNKDKQISKLNMEIQRLERVGKLSKEINNESQIFQSFRKPQSKMQEFSQQEFKSAFDYNTKTRNNTNSNPNNHEQITMMNLNFKENQNQTEFKQQPEILSPFMALNNPRNEGSVFSSQITVKKDREASNNTSFNDRNSHNNSYNNNSNKNNTSYNNNKLINPFQHFSATDSSGFYKKQNKQFDFSKPEDSLFQKKVHSSSVVDPQLSKFNIFGADSEIKKKSQLQIEDSRQFKFNDFDEDEFRDF